MNHRDVTVPFAGYQTERGLSRYLMLYSVVRLTIIFSTIALSDIVSG